MGRMGGKARMSRLSEEERSALGTSGVNARWDKERAERAKRPPVHEVVKKMIERIVESGKAHTLFVEKGYARFCESGSEYEQLWMTKSDTCVGTYGVGVSFSDVLVDVMAT